MRKYEPILILELGHQLEPAPMRTTEFAPSIAEASECEASTFGYAFPRVACPGKPGVSPGATLLLKRMAGCAARLGRACIRPNSAAKLMVRCECSSPPRSETGAAVKSANNVSGTGRQD